MVSCPRLRPPRPSAGGPFIVVATMVLQRFPSLGSKSRITARWRSFPSESMQRFPNSPPQIKNHCRTEGVSRQNPAAIAKSGAEIKNRSSSKPVLQAKPFPFAATKFRSPSSSPESRIAAASVRGFSPTLQAGLGSNKRQIFECFQG